MTGHRILALALVSPFLLTADERIADHNFHGWYNYFGDHPIAASKWGIHLEAQVRRHDVATQWQQLLLRPGVNYQASKAVMLTAGYAFVRSSTYSEFAAPAPASLEHRFWQQAWIRYRTGQTSWSTRLRFENRFLGGPDPRSGADGIPVRKPVSGMAANQGPALAEEVLHRVRRILGIRKAVSVQLRVRPEPRLCGAGIRLEADAAPGSRIHASDVPGAFRAAVWSTTTPSSCRCSVTRVSSESNDRFARYVVPRCTEPGYESPQSSVILLSAPQCRGEY